jgi:mannose-1-phosphate guanylyltransferase/mannose-1-phosphate guanylyltransferase/phosphomannomutase
VRLTGPVVIGDGSTIGAGAALKSSIVLPGTSVDENAIVIGGIVGHTGIVASLRPRA